MTKNDFLNNLKVSHLITKDKYQRMVSKLQSFLNICCKLLLKPLDLRKFYQLLNGLNPCMKNKRIMHLSSFFGFSIPFSLLTESNLPKLRKTIEHHVAHMD